MTIDLPAWAQSDERHPEREAEWRALATSLSESDIIIQGLTGKVAEYEQRAEYNAELVTEARAQLAALREAAKAVLGCKAREYTKEESALRTALADTAAAARAHDERVRAAAIAPVQSPADREAAARAAGAPVDLGSVERRATRATTEQSVEAWAKCFIDEWAAHGGDAALARVGPPPIDRELARALVRAGSYSAKPLVGDEETDHVVGVVLAERAR